MVGGTIGRTARQLPPRAFAFVMATGIISVGAYRLGPVWLSRTLLVIACVGFALVAIAFFIRCWRYPTRVVADWRAADRAFGYFTVVAGIDTVAARLDLAGHPLAAAILAAVGAGAWLFLTYALPATVVLWRSERSVLSSVDGEWLLWVVGAQSIAVVAASLVSTWPSEGELLATCAVVVWSVGIVLYLLLVAVIFVRWLSLPAEPAAHGPAYWILMGACAIGVLAGAGIEALPHSLAARAAVGGTVEGLTFVLWSFGSWWIPVLVVFAAWRHVARRLPLSYDSAAWSFVFPLGMYCAATQRFGVVAHLAFMRPIAQVALWVAVAAWVVVAAAGLVALMSGWRSTGHGVDAADVPGTAADHSV
jgi:tellurite resistance protein TehA-like permease